MGQTVGIDFGTTNTVVSYRNKHNKIVSLKVDGYSVIPSAVYYVSENEYYIGFTALQKGKVNPQGLVTSFKTDIGEPKVKRCVTFEDGTEKKISPHNVAQHFLQKLLLAIQNKLIKDFGTNGDIEKAVITVPAKFSPRQKEKIKQAGINAGLKSVELAYEPTSAAAAYQNDLSISNDTILVYDFGGGTFDVSVVQAKRKGDYVEYDELFTSGDKNLGGNEITNIIVNDILEQINEYFGIDWELDEDKKGLYRPVDRDSYYGKDYLNYFRSIIAITDVVEEMKLDLSMVDEIEREIILILDGDRVEDFTISYTKEEFEDLVSDYIDKTVQITKNVISELKKDGVHIDKVVLAGGSSNIPMIQETLSSVIKMKVFPSDDFSSLISKGAVVLNENSTNKVTQITNNEYGIIVKDGRILDKFEPLVPVKAKLPYSVQRPLYLNYDGQESLEFKIYERDIQNYPNSKRLVHEGIEFVYAVYVEDLPKSLRKNNTKINLTLTVQTDGSIDISANLLVDDKMVSKLTIKK